MNYAFPCALALVSGVASAADPAAIELFGTTYRVQRFDYRQEITFLDPLHPTLTIGLIECEGFHWLGNGHFLLSSNEMAQFSSFQNFIVEAELVTNPSGDVTGLQYVRTVLTNDKNLSPAPYDLDPAGVTIDSTGALVVADSQNEFLRKFDFVTGAPLGGDFAVNPPNSKLEDVTFANGQYVTVRAKGTFQLDMFALNGAFQNAILIGTALNSSVLSAPRGVTYFPDLPTAPSAFHGAGGVFLASMPSAHPGVQAVTTTGTEIGWKPLTDNGTPTGNPLLDSGSQQLSLDSVGFDPVTGRIFLVQQGIGDFNDSMWVLTPAERSFGSACAGSGGFTPKLEATGILQTGEIFSVDLTDGLGGGMALLVFGSSDASLPVNGGPCVLNVAPIVGPMLALPLSAGGPGQGTFSLGGLMPSGIPSLTHLELQAFVADPGVPQGFSATQGLEVTTF